MMKKFIQVEGARVMLVHHMPFDPVHGLHKSEEELLTMGFLVDEIPLPEQRPGKTALPYYTPNQGFYYEYVDKPAEPTDVLEAKLDYLLMMQGVN